MRAAVWGAALAAGLAIGGAAQAADYVVVRYENFAGIIDLAGITRTGDVARGTVTRTWPTDQDVGSGVVFRYLTTAEEFNCVTRVSYNNSLKAYSRNHVLVYESSERSSALEAVEPGSLGYEVMQTLCERGAANVGERQSAPDRNTLIDRLISD
jgi:hypothetical protein